MRSILRCPSPRVFVLSLLTVFLGVPEGAWAHSSPPGCTGNNLNINIRKSAPVVVNGDTVQFTVIVENPADPTTCDITLGPEGIVFICPGSDGTPSGKKVTLIPGGTVLPPGFAPDAFVIDCVINLDAPLTVAQAKVEGLNALLHDNEPNNPANIDKTVSVNAFTPCIDVTKEVACLEPGEVCGPYAKSAEGIKTSEYPLFCYRITVENCGTEPLKNVTVEDDKLSLAGCNFPGTLAPGQVVECLLQTEIRETTLNTVVASGVGVQTGVSTNAVDSALAIVKPASIKCEIILTSSFDMDEANCAENPPPAEPNPCDENLLLPAGFIGNIGFYMLVTNTGTATLENIQVAGLPAGCEPVLPDTLGEGGVVMIECNPLVTCPEGAAYAISVTADASDENGTVCVYDRNGVPISVNDRCDALIECEPPVACRVTGGGKQYASAEVHGAAEDEIPASLFPENADYVTHGGQVGAPFGEATPFDPNSDCIRGQWQHSRHGPDGSVGNFHSAYFDSLMCGCLGCEDPVTGEPITPLIKNALCNPDNRICGPEPRRAPANAICFSGVGNWSESNGKKGRENVVFRVYIEDRSEPGGSPPGRHHADDPPDVYSIQIWKINGNPDSAPNIALREAIACSTITDGINVPAAALAIRPPDVSDTGKLGRGNHQIHPATGATCK